MKTHGDPNWEDFPSYLDLVVPRVLEFLREQRLTITVFVVGQDAALEKNAAALSAIAEAEHEIGNHSFHHEPWLHLYSVEKIDEEIRCAQEQIERVTGQRPIGFRGPGFSCSPNVIRSLIRRGYQYDASTFPTFLGPFARAFYFLRANLDGKQKEDRKLLFGKLSEGFRPLRPYRWEFEEGKLTEIPVTTMPVFKLPIHLSYLLYLGQYSRSFALLYFRFGLFLCRATGLQPSILLHPLDFLGADDHVGLDFFPAMSMPTEEKLKLVSAVIDLLARKYQVVTMQQHCKMIASMSVSNKKHP